MNAPHEEIVAHVEYSSPLLAEWMIAHGPMSFPSAKPPFEALCRAIVGQQLSTRAAETVWQRFKDAFLDITPAEAPQIILQASEEALRQPGLSRSKAIAVRSLAEAFETEPDRYHFAADDSRTDADISKDLMRIKGIGPWTAQMFLMFTLQRPDVFAEGDLGIQKAMGRLSGVDRLSPEECLTMSAPWSPHRSIICLHLWRSLNNKP